MARSDDMDWLYRDDPEPEPTRVLPQGRYPDPQSAPPPPSSPGRTRTQAPPPPSPPRGTRHRRRRRRPFLRFLTMLLAAWLVFLIGTPAYAWLVGTRVDSAPAGERPAEQPGTTVLLVGSDARDTLSDEDRGRLGTGSAEGRRTDTMMLMHTPVTGEPVLLSLPRDSYVSIPGRDRNKLNAAYSFGGAPLLVETVERNTGIRVDGYLEVGFLGVVDVVDALGGVEVCPEFDIDDRDSHLTLDKGCQTVDGVTALGYVRMRKADPRGDLGRMDRQRETLGAIAEKAFSPMSILNPVRYWKLNMAASRSLARGDDTGLGAMVSVGAGFLGTVTGSGLSLTVPVADADAQTSAGSSVIWDEELSAEVFQALSSGDTTALEKYR